MKKVGRPAYILPQKYIKKYLAGKSANQISKDVGVSAQAVINALKRQGIETRGTKHSQKTRRLVLSPEQINEYLMGATSVKRLSKELKVSWTTVSKAFCRQGIKIRTLEDSNKLMYGEKQNREINRTKKWKRWREAVYERDNHTCIMCGTNAEDAMLNPHHIKRKTDYPNLVFDVNNGVTLCFDCHVIVTNDEQSFEEDFTKHVYSCRNSEIML